MMRALLKKVCMKVSRNGLCYRDKCYQKRVMFGARLHTFPHVRGGLTLQGVGKVYLSFVVGAGAIVSPRCTSCVCFMLLLVIFFDFVACWGE
jgi:hypothetical protein